MTCPDCTEASARRWWGGYRIGCAGCAARSAARSLAAFNAIHPRGDGDRQPLRDLVHRLLPEHTPEAARKAVRHWWDHDHNPETTTA